MDPSPMVEVLIVDVTGIPDEEDAMRRYLTLLARFEPEESARVGRYKFRDDRKRALIGRILARYVPCEHLKLVESWDDVALARTETNRPTCSFRARLDSPAFDFNISHHGQWCVIGYSLLQGNIGVDVMTYEEPKRGRGVFFESMRNCFTPSEWAQIGDSLERFYRFWALKESYLKATGVGIGFNLQRLSFELLDEAEEGERSRGPRRARLELDGVSLTADDDWMFSVWEIGATGSDGAGCVAVGLRRDHLALDEGNRPLIDLCRTELHYLDALPLLAVLEREAERGVVA